MTAKRKVTQSEIKPGLIFTDNPGLICGIVLSSEAFGEDDDTYAALLFSTTTGRRTWLDWSGSSSSPSSRVSAVRLPGEWLVSEALVPIDTEMLRTSAPAGLNESCIFDTGEDCGLASGTKCQHCRVEVRHACSCEQDHSCSEPVEYSGDLCQECLDDCSEVMEYCSVCDEDCGHDKTIHEWCEHCEDYVGHEEQDCPNQETPSENQYPE